MINYVPLTHDIYIFILSLFISVFSEYEGEMQNDSKILLYLKQPAIKIQLNAKICQYMYIVCVWFSSEKTSLYFQVFKHRDQRLLD